MSPIPSAEGTLSSKTFPSTIPIQKGNPQLLKLPEGVLAKVLEHLGPLGNSMRVCKALSELMIEHTTSAHIKAARKISFHFFDSTKFTHLRRMDIDGFQPHIGSIPPFYCLEEFRWTNCAELTDSDVWQIAKSKNLKLVHLTQGHLNIKPQITGLGLRHLLVGLSHLANLKITLASIHGLASDPIDTSLSTLKTLSLHMENARETHFLKSLRWLIENAANLQSLHLENACVNQIHVVQILTKLKSLERLKILNCIDPDLSPALLRVNTINGLICQLTNLQLTNLHLDCPDWSESFICKDFQKILGRSPNLIDLKIGQNVHWTFESIHALTKRAEYFKKLRLRACPIAKFIGLFKRLSSLTHLDVAYNQNVANLGDFQDLPTLKTLRLKHEVKADIPVAMSCEKIGLIAAKFLNLQTLELENFIFTDEIEKAWDRVGTLKHLEDFKLKYTHLPKGVLKHLFKRLPNIGKLAISHSFIEREDLQGAFSSVPDLKKIKLLDTYINLKSILDAKLKTVTEFAFYPHPMPLQSLRKIGQIWPNLEVLDFSITEISSEDVFPLLESLKKLQKLDLSLFDYEVNPLTDQQLTRLVDLLPHLKTIGITENIYRSTADAYTELSNFFKSKGVEFHRSVSLCGLDDL